MTVSAPAFAGVDHVALTVSDLDASERFYTEVLGLVMIIDFGSGRLLMDKRTGFVLGLAAHDGRSGKPFTELATGLDHLGFAVADREELVAWESRFRRLGVAFTPIRDMPLSYHLNFRDPDGIALELTAPTETYAAAIRELRSREWTDDELRERAGQLMGE